jgi:hypothetical protein
VAHVEQGRYEAIAFKEGYAQLLSLAIVIEPGQRVEDSTQFLSTLLQSLRRRLERVHSVRHAAFRGTPSPVNAPRFPSREGFLDFLFGLALWWVDRNHQALDPIRPTERRKISSCWLAM